MTMSRLSIFARFSLALVTAWLLHCGSQSPDPGLEMCPDGTVSARCVPMTCIDKIRNGAETDVDCGGPTCEKCTVNQACAVGRDCDSGLCAAGVCQTVTVAAPSCTDGLKNAMETDVDCGGTACSKCALGAQCAAADDCLSATCTGGRCAVPPAICTDRVKNGSETDVDCGGSTCPKCDLGKACIAASDCLSTTCSGGVCVPPPATCTDGIKNGSETDVDCGGSTCNKCTLTKMCVVASDCSSATCSGGRCVAPPATCTDGIRNGSETDVDCGGPTCSKCALTQMCVAASDCSSATCSGGRCVAPPDLCIDGIKDGSETDVDCGGPTCSKCALTKMCVAASDCASGACANNQCATILGICTIPPFMFPVPLTNPPYASAAAAATYCTTVLKGTWK